MPPELEEAICRMCPRCPVNISKSEYEHVEIVEDVVEVLEENLEGTQKERNGRTLGVTDSSTNACNDRMVLCQYSSVSTK